MLGSAAPGRRIKGSQYTVRELLDDYSAGLGNQLADQPEAEAEIRAHDRPHVLLSRSPRPGRATLQTRDRTSTEGGRPTGRRTSPDSLVDYGWNLFRSSEDTKRRSRQLREALEIYHQRGVRGQLSPSMRWQLLQHVLASSGRHDEAERVIQEAWAEMQGYDELPPEFAVNPLPLTSSYFCAGFAYYFATIGKQERGRRIPSPRDSRRNSVLRKTHDSPTALT